MRFMVVLLALVSGVLGSVLCVNCSGQDTTLEAPYSTVMPRTLDSAPTLSSESSRVPKGTYYKDNHVTREHYRSLKGGGGTVSVGMTIYVFNQVADASAFMQTTRSDITTFFTWTSSSLPSMVLSRPDDYIGYSAETYPYSDDDPEDKDGEAEEAAFFRVGRYVGSYFVRNDEPLVVNTYDAPNFNVGYTCWHDLYEAVDYTVPRLRSL